MILLARVLLVSELHVHVDTWGRDERPSHFSATWTGSDRYLDVAAFDDDLHASPLPPWVLTRAGTARLELLFSLGARGAGRRSALARRGSPISGHSTTESHHRPCNVEWRRARCRRPAPPRRRADRAAAARVGAGGDHVVQQDSLALPFRPALRRVRHPRRPEPSVARPHRPLIGEQLRRIHPAGPAAARPGSPPTPAASEPGRGAGQPPQMSVPSPGRGRRIRYRDQHHRPGCRSASTSPAHRLGQQPPNGRASRTTPGPCTPARSSPQDRAGTPRERNNEAARRSGVGPGRRGPQRPNVATQASHTAGPVGSAPAAAGDRPGTPGRSGRPRRQPTTHPAGRRRGHRRKNGATEEKPPPLGRSYQVIGRIRVGAPVKLCARPSASYISTGTFAAGGSAGGRRGW